MGAKKNEEKSGFIRSNLRGKELVHYKIDIYPYLQMTYSEPEACQHLVDYIREFLKAVVMLNKYYANDRSYEMVDNGPKFYEDQRELYLSKAVRTLFFLNTMAHKRAGSFIINAIIDKQDRWQCVALIESFDRALWEQARLDVTYLQIKQPKKTA